MAGNIFFNQIDIQSEDLDYEGSIDGDARTMKIDHSRLRKSTSEPPAECKVLIDRLKKCSRIQLLDELSKISTWTFGKCELGHWKEILAIFDTILEEATDIQPGNKWALLCDSYDSSNRKLLLWILHFTTLLIEHSFSRHTYKSMDRLLSLLASSDMSVVLGVLNLLYMFSKRSNFITRMQCDQRSGLVSRLHHLAESWGGKENGFGLADCCDNDKPMPPSGTTLHFEFHNDNCSDNKDSKEAREAREARMNDPKAKQNMIYIHVEHVDQLRKTPAEIMKGVLAIYNIPADKEMLLFTHVRLAYHFSMYRNRLLCVQARLQALSVLVYANALQDSAHTLLYTGLLEELVELIELKLPFLVEIRSAALRTLTSIIHLDRNPHFPKLNMIIDVTGASLYHGFLPVLVRNCITSLTAQTQEKKGKAGEKSTPSTSDAADPTTDTRWKASVPDVGVMNPEDDSKTRFPLPLATALFSFLYHLASYESGGDALVSCGMMESLLQVINWHGVELEHITFVTRAVRVIDLITNNDMQAFYSHAGLQSFINRLDVEVNLCHDEHSYEFKLIGPESEELERQGCFSIHDEDHTSPFEFLFVCDNVGKTCLPQRAALLKSMLNFLKKALQDATFAEHIRHLMEGTLPSSLKYIISNAEYYGPSLFLLATDVVTVYVFQEPSLLSSIQDNGLTDVVLQALLVKEVPATREVLASLPNVFSALCLNARGLASFVKCKPFDKLFKVLLNPNYLSAMRKRRSSDPLGDAASNLGNAMDELMRHQPSLKADATSAIIKILNELCALGTDPQYVCWRHHSKSEVSPIISQRSTANADGNSSDEDDDDEEEASTSSQTAQVDSQENQIHSSEKHPIALAEYILNVTKFLDAILSNNSTDDHCREFVSQGGLVPLLRILGLPNLPVDCPIKNSAQAVASVCKSILNLAHESRVLEQGLTQLNEVLEKLKPLYLHLDVPGGSKLLHELASAPQLETAFSTASATPLLHAMGAAHCYVLMFVHVCRTGQNEIRTLSLQHWGSEEGLTVLKGLAELYTSLVWESTLLLALCSDDVIPSDCDFGKEDMEKLNIPLIELKEIGGGDAGNVASAMEALTTNPSQSSMDIDDTINAGGNRPSSQQLKYFKPLLGASSRLGRALAELFGLLVKLCVGSPIRQRRGQTIVSTPSIPSQSARSVATALNLLLANGLNFERLPPSPVPKFRLTFLICSVGFTSPMLFDEKKYPYHLMLQKFVSLGECNFFRAFSWALSAGGTIDPAEALEHPKLPEGTGEFLHAWLTLLEKMVNPKAILDSPHIISTKSTQGAYKNAIHFDPVEYLMSIQYDAFEACMLLWGRKPLPNYGRRITESILTILRHILRGENIIREKLNKTDDTKSETATTAGATAGTTTPPPQMGPLHGSQLPFEVPSADVMHASNLRALLDMGFSRNHALDALIRTMSLERATDYLLSRPNQQALGRTVTQATTPAETEMTEDDQFIQAIAMSLDAGPSSSVPKKKEQVRGVREPKPIPEILIDRFAEGALPICLDLIERVPKSVFKVCDLLVTIMKRNGPQFRENLLDRLLLEIYDISTTILQESPNVTTDVCCESEQSQRLGYYTHLYTLFFEVPSYFDMRGPCGLAIFRCELVPHFIKLLSLAEDALTINRKASVPKWLTPILLLLDSLGKVSVATTRKRAMHLCTKRFWKWFDVVSGKWTIYSHANNRVINESYWNGEQSVRITCGRRRYTINFNSMQQINEESNNNRPILMTPINLLAATDPKTDEEYLSMETAEVKLTEKEEDRCIPMPGFSKEQAEDIVRSCVILMKTEIDKDTLHAIMRVCLRLTQDFDISKIFVKEGGVSCLIHMKEKYAFTGFRTLATLLIRHTFEAPNIVAYAMEKVIRGRTLVSLPPPYKELMFLLRSIGSAVTRNSDIFFGIAKSVIKLDNVFRRQEDIDSRLPLCTEGPSRTIAPLVVEQESIDVIYCLLNALLRPIEMGAVEEQEFEPPVRNSPSIMAGNCSTSNMCQRASDLLSNNSSSNDILNLENQDYLRLKIPRATVDSNNEKKPEDDSPQRPILAKHSILKILADSVVSYAGVAKLITDYTYDHHMVDNLSEDTSCLSFLFDKILPMDEGVSDRDCSMMCRTLVSGIASCNHAPEAQAALVTEVKAALIRALLLPESSDKHTRLQHITGIILSMIEQCPPVQQVRIFKQQTFNASVNNIARLMLRKGIFNDLARVAHCLDMSSPNFPITINSAMKPMECLSKIVNQPVTGNNTGTKKRTRNANQPAADPNGEELLDETVEIAENADDDVAAAAAGLENAPNVPDNVLDEIMEQLLERGPNGNGGTMDIDDEANIIAYERETDATEELMSTDSGDSDEAEEEENVHNVHNVHNVLNVHDENEAAQNNANNDDEEEDDDEADDDDDEDDVEGFNSSEYEHTPGNVDRDEDIVMIQYADHESENESLPRMVRWNENGFAIPIFDDSGQSNDQSAPAVHPLLQSRHVTEEVAMAASVTRAQRTNRARRYQYLQLNTRTPNPPVILQRLLGPAGQNIHLNSATFPPPLGGHHRESARVVVMDNFGIFPSVEEQIDFVDQTGYFFGPSMMATINHIPVVLHWWKEESRFVDGESMNDIVTYIGNKLIPTLLKQRARDIDERKKKQDVEDAKAKEKAEEEEKSAKKEDHAEIILSSSRAAQGAVEDFDEDIDGIAIEESSTPPTSNVVHIRPIAINPNFLQTLQNHQAFDNFARLVQTSTPLSHSPPALELMEERENQAELDEDDDDEEDDAGTFERRIRIPRYSSDEIAVLRQHAVESARYFDEREQLRLVVSRQAASRQAALDLAALVDQAALDHQAALDQATLHQATLDQPEPEDPELFTRRTPTVEENDTATYRRLAEQSPLHSRYSLLPHSGLEWNASAFRTATMGAPGTVSPTASADTTLANETADDSANTGTATNTEASTSTSDILSATGENASNTITEEIPEGVDPSFLEALPPEMRREVLDQHRILRLQQRMAATVSTLADAAADAVAGGSTEVSREFLAALPPSLQEEVLTQQRLEHQRQAAARANPDEPVDAASFFETLQPSLRTMILSDMEDSQMSVLPPDLAAEAQTLRRDWEARNRQIVQERFLEANLTTIIRHSTRGRLGSRFNTAQLLPQWAQRPDFTPSNPPTNVKIRGRQLLDHEALSCLLVLLFVDDPKLNTGRLHRVIRNLCYHVPTREWVIRALLSIIDRSVHVKPDDNLNKPKRVPKPGPLSSKLTTDTKNMGNGANWLNIRMEAALGCHANVFIVTRVPGKRTEKNSSNSSVTIHPQAAPIVCRNALDLFTSLSRSFPTFLLPLKMKEKEKPKTGTTSKYKPENTDFWEMILKLDATSTKKGKSLNKNHGNFNICSDVDTIIQCFDQSAFGQLLGMLSANVIIGSVQLTDKLLRLLSVISMGMPELQIKVQNPAGGDAVPINTELMDTYESVAAPESALKLAINVLTYKSCSEEGLEEVTTLLLNLSNCSLEMSRTILELLLNGAKNIGDIVRIQIYDMLHELKSTHKPEKPKSLEDPSPSTSKGTLSNRFTNEHVIIAGAIKVKTSCDLQLPSMAALTSKSSSQVFFLRVLRVIVQIREAIQKKETSTEREESAPANRDLSPLSDQLEELEHLWNTLSQCLLELEHTPDHHAVLVLQPAVEAFFLVHSPPSDPSDAAKADVSDGDREEAGAAAATRDESTSTTRDRDESASTFRPREEETAVSAFRESEGDTEDESSSSFRERDDSGSSVRETERDIANTSVLSNSNEATTDATGRSSVPPDQLKFLNFAEKHRTVLNQILRQTTLHLADGPFSVLVDHTRVLDFDIKRRYFRTELERLDQNLRREETAVHVRREHIFEDSFRELYRRTPEEWKNRFYIVFEEEEGQDAGGLLREWYVIISRDIFNPMYALFTVSPGDRVTYMINSASHYNPNHLCYYKFVGRVIAKAIYDNKLLECYFTRSFYKHILGISVKYTDMESEDYSFYRGLVYLMENNITNFGCDLTFSTEINEFGVTETRDLIPNGRDVPVTEENKMEYVRRSCQMKMTGAIRQQLTAFLEGFYDIIPKRLISIFNEQELELLISGLPNVDIEDLKSNSEYHKYQANSLQIQWFWRALRSFDQADRAKFLQFVTGTSKVPLQGFGALEGMNGVQKFQIHRDDRSTDRLPSAHTCFNQLDLPVYETYDKLRSYLLKAIHECSEGFGFA